MTADIYLNSPTSFSRAITFLNHTVPDFTDNGASNFIKYGNDYFATSETNYIRMIDPVTLETKDKVSEREREAPPALTSWQRSAAGSQSSFVLDPAGGLHEVPAGELGLLPPALRQGRQHLQHGNFNSGEGQDQIHAVQSPCCVSEW